jgi:Carboxypeptidase regulatory-like domain
LGVVICQWTAAAAIAENRAAMGTRHGTSVVAVGLALCIALLARSALAEGQVVTGGLARPASVVVSPDVGIAAATGTVSGTILWTDFEGHTHPVRGALVQFFDGNNAYLGVSTATDLTGHYAASISTPTNSATITVFTQDLADAKIAVFPPQGPSSNRWAFSSTFGMTGNVTINLTFPAPVKGTPGFPSPTTVNDTAARAFSVFDGMMTYWAQWSKLAAGVGSTLSRASIDFPVTLLAAPSSADESVTREEALSWDVLGERFGGFAAFFSQKRQVVPSLIDQNELNKAWVMGLRRFMSLALQETPADPSFPFPTGLAGVKDRLWSSPETTPETIDPEAPSPLGGPRSDRSVLGLLWDLFTPAAPTSDGFVTEFHPHVSPAVLWNGLNVALPCNPCDRLDRLWTSIGSVLGGTSDRPLLFQVAADFATNGLAPEARNPVDRGTLSATTSPLFSWRPPANANSPAELPYEFYVALSADQLQTFMLLGSTIETSFQPTQAQWTSALGPNPAGKTYQWFVAARQPTIDAGVLPEGFYWLSNLMSFAIGTNTGRGLATVTVKDATTGQPIANAAVAASGGGGTQITNASGQTIFDLLAGSYQFTAAATGYSPASAAATVATGQDTPVTIALAPQGGNSPYSVVVTRTNSVATDFDFHITGPAPGGGRFHVYYANANVANPDPALPTCNSCSNIYEQTISIPTTARRPGVYRVSYRGNDDICHQSLQSLSVRLFYGNQLLRTFAPPVTGCASQNPELGDTWTVFELTMVDDSAAHDTVAAGGISAHGVSPANVQ